MIRIQVILRYIGMIFLFNATFLLISATISFFNHDAGLFPLTFSFLIVLLFGLFPLIFVPRPDEITNNEGMLIVVGSWLLSCLIGMLPFILYGGEFSIPNAWFESVSGYTTTGATILNNIEGLPQGILFWRASTHWMGGIGIIVFVLAVLPSTGFVGVVLSRSEMSASTLKQFKVRTAEAVHIILYIYVGITVLETIFLMIFGMNLFDAVTHAFATVATGGFSDKNLSVAAFHSVSIEVTIMVFMILSGINFALLFSALVGRITDVKTSSVLKYYLGANFVAIILASLNLYFNGTYPTIWASLRFSSFQILSVGTSTGFASADSSVWPWFSQLIIIFFTLQCAMAGSTSGGIKTDRVVIFFKALARRIKQVRYPNAVIPLVVDNKKLDENSVSLAILYIVIYIFFVFVSTMLLTLMGVDGLSAFSGSAAAMGNVGPGLSSVGSLDNYSMIPAMGKYLLGFVMLLGRLEIYGLVVFFFPSTWKLRR